MPSAGLVRDAAGNLYGTTSVGGSARNGTVFKLDKNGNETVLHNFSGPDGFYPDADLIRDTAGDLYGTTADGGSMGSGVAFKLDASGNESVLHTFIGVVAGSTGCPAARCTDGAVPVGALFRDGSGNIYGTAFNGGVSGEGVVFKLTH